MDLERSSRNIEPEGISFTLVGLTDDERLTAVSAANSASDLMDVLRAQQVEAGNAGVADHLEGLRIDYGEVAERTRGDEVPTLTFGEFNLLYRSLKLPAELRRATSPHGRYCDELGLQAVKASMLARELSRLLTNHDRQEMR